MVSTTVVVAHVYATTHRPLTIKLPPRNAHNTIHIDDLSRNFALNPVNGIKIDPFHNAHTLEAQGDRELSVLQRYLRFVAEKRADFRKANHRVSTILLNFRPPSFSSYAIPAMEASVEASTPGRDS